jgi:ADP-ribose pyrophosphatase YjhB (NUDIX family)
MEQQNGKIRVSAMCLFVHDGKTLVSKGYDSVKGQAFYRVLGGGVNFFETAEDAVRREIQEELQSDVENLVFLTVTENIFTYLGKKGHEIVFMYSGSLSRKELYGAETIHVVEETHENEAVWVPIDEILNGKVPLYPNLDYNQYLK